MLIQPCSLNNSKWLSLPFLAVVWNQMKGPVQITRQYRVGNSPNTPSTTTNQRKMIESQTSRPREREGHRLTPKKARAPELRRSENTGKKKEGERPKPRSRRKGRELATLAARVQSGEQGEAGCKCFTVKNSSFHSIPTKWRIYKGGR